jgi:hypothetical protein
MLFKERRPFKLKKGYPSEQWQVISFRLIPLKPPVSCRWTVPLSCRRVIFTSNLDVEIYTGIGCPVPVSDLKGYRASGLGGYPPRLQ